MPMLPMLIEPRALARHLNDPTLLLVDVRSADGYAAGHLAGAQHVAPGELVDGTPPAVGKLPGTQRLLALVQRIGLRSDSHVVAYDDEGGGWAGRLLWTLDTIGHRRWSYLNGGIHAWLGERLALTTDRPPAARGDFTAIHIDAACRITADELLRCYAAPNVQVWDARSPAEYRGERSGSQRAGRIPGALNLDWLELMDPARQLRVREDLAAVLSAHGIDPACDVITHCQTHHRSGLSYLVARLLGFERIRAYDGSWSEWGNRSDTPIETGPAAPNAPGNA